MTCDEVLKQFGLPALLRDRDELRRLLAEEIERERRGEAGEEMLRVQLFSLGLAEDVLLIWEAKESSFDAGCGLDVQLMCGAGLEATKDYLAQSTVPAARAALAYLRKSEAAGDFSGWNRETALGEYRRYYGLESASAVDLRVATPTLKPSKMNDDRYRTLWPRFCAGVVDIVVVLPFLVAFWIFDLSTLSWGGWVLGLAMVVVNTTYFVIMHARTGQTIGKRVTKVRVVDTTTETTSR